MMSWLEANEELFSKVKDSSLYNFIRKSEVDEMNRKFILTCETIGQTKYSEFVKERMKMLGMLSSINKRTKVMAQKRILGRLALVCRSNREFDLKEVIGTYVLQVVPSSLMLSDCSLYPGHEGKSQLLQSLERLCNERKGTESVPIIGRVESIVIIDAMVIVQKPLSLHGLRQLILPLEKHQRFTFYLILIKMVH